MKDKAAEYREKLVELAVEQDDAAMEAYLEGELPDVATLKALIRKGTLNQSFVPVLCGSSFKNKGVQALLDAVVDYLPSPLDITDVQGINPAHDQPDTRETSDSATLSLLAFTLMNAPFVGSLPLQPINSGPLPQANHL